MVELRRRVDEALLKGVDSLGDIIPPPLKRAGLSIAAAVVSRPRLLLNSFLCFSTPGSLPDVRPKLGVGRYFFLSSGGLLLSVSAVS